MIDCGNAKYVHPFHAAKVPYSQEKQKKIKNVKRVCPKKNNQRAKRRRIGQEKNERNEPRTKGQESVLVQMPLLYSIFEEFHS